MSVTNTATTVNADAVPGKISTPLFELGNIHVQHTGMTKNAGGRNSSSWRTRANLIGFNAVNKASTMKRVMSVNVPAQNNQLTEMVSGLKTADGCDDVSQLRSGCSVVLLCGTYVVGEANLHAIPNEHARFVRHLHGFELSKSDMEHEFLVVI